MLLAVLSHAETTDNAPAGRRCGAVATLMSTANGSVRPGVQSVVVSHQPQRRARSTPLMRSGRGGDTFRSPWLGTAVRALLDGRTSAPPVAVGLDTAGTVMTVRLDGTGASVVFDPDPPSSTVLRAEPEVVLALAAGAVSVDQAITRGNLQGDPQELAAVFGAGDSAGGNARQPPLPT